MNSKISLINCRITKAFAKFRHVIRIPFAKLRAENTLKMLDKNTVIQVHAKLCHMFQYVSIRNLGTCICLTICTFY